jgi:hypothetical protein
LVGGPAGASIGALVASALGVGSTPEAGMQSLTTDPTAAIKLREVEAKRQVDLQALLVDQSKAEIAAQVQNAADVNATMRAEVAAEHWPSYSWRPFIGFMFGAYVGSMWLLPLFGKTPAPLSADLTLAIGAILGVAAHIEGKGVTVLDQLGMAQKGGAAASTAATCACRAALQAGRCGG